MFVIDTTYIKIKNLIIDILMRTLSQRLRRTGEPIKALGGQIITVPSLPNIPECTVQKLLQIVGESGLPGYCSMLPLTARLTHIAHMYCSCNFNTSNTQLADRAINETVKFAKISFLYEMKSPTKTFPSGVNKHYTFGLQIHIHKIKIEKLLKLSNCYFIMKGQNEMLNIILQKKLYYLVKYYIVEKNPSSLLIHALM